MKRSFAWVLFLLIGLPLMVLAQNQDDYLIEIKPTKKIIHVDKLGISDNTTVMDILEMMPEVVGRQADVLDFRLSNYSIQINDKDVGQSRDMILEQTKLIEVKQIEISLSPTVSEQRKGQGGVIDIILKDVEEGISGNATLDAATSFGKSGQVSPSVYLNYRKGNFSMRSSLLFSASNVNHYQEINQFHNNGNEYLSMDTITELFHQETAKLNLVYDTGRDKLDFWVWESYGMDRVRTRSAVEQDYLLERDIPSVSTWNAFEYTQLTTGRTQDLNVVTNIEYSHQYANGGCFDTEFDYSYTPSRGNNETRFIVPGMEDIYGGYRYENSNKKQPHELDLLIKSKHQLLPASHPYQLTFEYGINGSYLLTNPGSNEGYYLDYTPVDSLYENVDRNVRVLYLSPYTQLDLTAGPLTFRAGVRYQYQHRKINIADLGTSFRQHHDVTCNVSLAYQVKPHHNLRLVAARNLVRPSDDQVYPFLIFTPTRSVGVMGNDSLNPAYYHSISLNYTFDHQVKEHYMTGSVELNYLHVSDLIVPITRTTTVQNSTLTYKTYTNQGHSDVLSLNYSFFYVYRIFALNFSGNVYDNIRHTATGTESCWFYNIAVEPIFSFRHRWTLSAKFLYNSRVINSTSYQGDCFMAQIKLSKDWGNWNVHFMIDDIFDYRTTDCSFNENETIFTAYDLYKRCFIAGFCYKF